MTSNDNQQYITVDLFNSKMETLMAQIKLGNEQLRNEFRAEISNVRSEISNVRSEFRSEMQILNTNVQVNSAKIEMLNHTFYWGFALMTIILTFLAIFVPHFINERKEKKHKEEAEKFQKTYTTRDEVLQLIREVITNPTGNIGAVGK